ncbi:MAG TPA: hypothetical protein VE864_10775, partial [Streptosporangiaceae bacterium]|nr:hypothetical protein [Streptosporangiaceae bacterium]
TAAPGPGGRSGIGEQAGRLSAEGAQAIAAGGASAAEEGGQFEHFPVGQTESAAQLEQAFVGGQGFAVVVAGRRGRGPLQAFGHAGLAAVAADPVDHRPPAAAELELQRGRLIAGTS